MLENTPVFAEKICQYLDLEDDADDVLTVCNMAINLIESINQKYCDEVIRAISRRIEGCAKTVGVYRNRMVEHQSILLG